MNRRNQKSQRNHVYHNIIMYSILLAFVICVAIFAKGKLVQADKSRSYTKTFQTIEIQSGDTLTSIAEEYACSEADYEDYIDEVMQINQLRNDTIHAGCYLMVPVYERNPL